MGTAALMARLQNEQQKAARTESLKKRICSGSDELKSLQKLLSAAYLNKELEAQMASKELQSVHDAADHEKLRAEMAALNVLADAKEKEKEALRTQKLLESKVIIER